MGFMPCCYAVARLTVTNIRSLTEEMPALYETLTHVVRRKTGKQWTVACYDEVAKEVTSPGLVGF